ncbi:hypothetical protein [Pseudoxanthomonas koreensis]|uniref:hypothetical protein n=1 Tax=Pseudoxanthomonas koreensis TaxID=266061 RepID=UPI001390F615|nr:hypothetical protein [Pseudoxanthomonas koreensis]KAF1693122.1 hypothetical protein CSC64_06195 [Pseudoxanthomonas koreensis]
MSGLALTHAPPSARPLRFLLTAPLWGVVAGVLLVFDGDALALGRWAPPAVVLVHLFTLGVLGNAMLGSLLQFLPVAAATPLPGARVLAPLAHAALNLGLLLFAVGLYRSHALLAPASLLLAGALLAVVLPPLPALLRRGAGRLLRAGIGVALLALLATVALGVLAAAVLGGRIALPLDRVVDAHAMLGAGGWMLCLLGAVASTTLPMFQGTVAVPPRVLRAWLAATAVLLVAGVTARLAGAAPLWPALALALPAATFALAVLWLQWRAPHRRNPALLRFWRAGSIALLLAGLALCTAAAGGGTGTGPRAGMFAGLFALGIGVPLLVNGMLLEITSFITWVALRGRCPRGVRILAVGRLLPDEDKHLALCAHLAAAVLLVLAVAWPPLAMLAGILLAVASATSIGCMLRCLHRARAFALEHGAPRIATA